MQRQNNEGVKTLGDKPYSEDDYEYSGSPLPLVTFLILTILTLLWDYLPILSLVHIPLPIVIFVAGIFFILMLMTFAINDQWEEAIILRFGRYKRLVGPGLFFKWPLVEEFHQVDKRIQTLDVSRQEVMTKDNISLVADAVVFMKIENTVKAVINIQDIETSVRSYAQTTMRDVIGNVELDDLLAERDEIAERIKEIVDRETAEWGVDIISVNLQNIELPENMKRVMARQAEAERERRAVIIKSEGELIAAKNLESAVQKMSTHALYLRTLSTLEDITPDPSNTIVFALPLDITRGEVIGLTGFVGAASAKRAATIATAAQIAQESVEGTPTEDEEAETEDQESE